MDHILMTWEYPAMSEKLIQNIEHRLEELGKKAAAVSKEAGLGDSFIRDMKRKGANPSVDNLAKLAEVLETTAAKLLDGTIPDEEDLQSKGLPVLGVIEAGAFRDISVQSQDEEFETVEMWKDRRFAHARQYALRVSGDSMNEVFQDGSFVICVNFADSGISLKPGLILHVERTIAGNLVETTIKEYQVEDDHAVLMPRSTSPLHKPIMLNGDENTTIEVKGIVIGEWKPLDL
jgi:SOS-response transcriptional repressor LexA